MQQLDLGEALVVIYDSLRGNMLTTRSILHGMGFRNIEGFTSFENLVRRLKNNDTSILFIEASEDTEQVVELLQSIRMGSTKCNPFLPIVSTLWVGNSDIVANLLNAGCDDVLLRPFSVAKTQERVRAIIENRKRFVVTSDYVGPDRGKPKTGRYSVEAFEVPNPLKIVVCGGSNNPVKHLEELENAKKRVNKERLAKLARRIAIAAEVTLQSCKDFNKNNGFVLDLLETTYELVRTAKRMDNEEINDMAIVLENIASKTASGTNTAENANLTRQLALAIFVAYASDDGEIFKKDLELTLSSVRNRLNKARDRDDKIKNLVVNPENVNSDSNNKDDDAMKYLSS